MKPIHVILLTPVLLLGWHVIPVDHELAEAGNLIEQAKEDLQFMWYDSGVYFTHMLTVLVAFRYARGAEASKHDLRALVGLLILNAWMGTTQLFGLHTKGLIIDKVILIGPWVVGYLITMIAERLPTKKEQPGTGRAGFVQD